MTKYKKLFTKFVPSSKTAYKQFDAVPVKRLSSLKRNNAFKKTAKTLFGKHKKFWGVTLVAGATTAYAVTWVENYIASNSGCFLLSDDGACKVRELSCCQPDPVDNLSFCQLPIPQPEPCQHFNEDTEKSCCRFCDCKVQPCLPGQTLECRRPTVGQALSYLSENVTSTLLNWTSPLWKTILSYVLWIAGIGSVFLGGWMLWVWIRNMRM